MAVPLNQGPSATPQQIAGATAGTVLAPYAQQIYDLGVQYNVDPASFVAVAKFEHVLTPGGTNADLSTNVSGPWNWIDFVGPGAAAYGGFQVPGKRFGGFPDPVAGIRAFYELITREYYTRGQTTFEDVLGATGNPHSLAPSFENSQAYYTNVTNFLRSIGTGAGIPIDLGAGTTVSATAGVSADQPSLSAGGGGGPPALDVTGSWMFVLVVIGLMLLAVSLLGGGIYLVGQSRH